MQDKSSQSLQQEALASFNKKSPLERTLIAGLKGAPELGQDEKRLYLGEFRERVLVMLTAAQVAEPAVYPEVVSALNDARAGKLVINGSISDHFTGKYKRLAKKMNLPYTVVVNPEYQKQTGLVVVSPSAVNVPDIRVEDREKRLVRLGVSKKLINAAGKKVCSRCRRRVVDAAPGEAVNYPSLSWADRLLGEKCPAHDVDYKGNRIK